MNTQIRQDRSYASSGKTLRSKSATEQEIQAASEQKEGLFAGRTVDVKSNMSMKDRFLNMLSSWTGYKEDETTSKKQYLLRNLVNLLGEKDLSPGAKTKLERIIEHSKTFKEIMDNNNTITPEKLMQIRLDVQLDEEFLTKATPEELEDVLLSPNLSNETKTTVLYYLGIAHRREENYSGMVKAYQKMENFSGLNPAMRHHVLKVLVDDYRGQLHDPQARLDAYTSLLDLVLDAENPDNSQLKNHVKSLLDKKSPEESSQILESLLKDSRLWTGQNSLSIDQWTSIVDNPNIFGTLAPLSLKKYITVGAGINKDLFLNPNLPENMLPQKEGDIDNNDWDTLKAEANNLFEFVNDKKDQGQISRFFDECMRSEAAKTPEGRQAIRKRVAATIDYLKNLRTGYEASVDEAEKGLLRTQIQDTLDLMAAEEPKFSHRTITGETTYPDRSIVALINLENHIKLIKNPQYMPHMLVQMFKLEAIRTQLTRPERTKYPEIGTQSQLYYDSGLNDPLELGLPPMPYENATMKMPLEQALEQTSRVFTEKDLINFAVENKAFRKAFEAEKNALVNQLHDESQRERAEMDFYKTRARQLFQEAGFLARE